MYDWGYIEKYGHGIEFMKDECRKHPLVNLKFDLKPHRVSVIFEKTEKFVLDGYEENILKILKIKKMN